ncbi:MAG TPA: DinB family protein [Vicinamibacterales bacterium]|jgi:uncharacterized damage-inducible protein DinB
MNCYGGKDLARAYRTVRENTIKVAEDIPESKLDFAPAPGVRTVRQMLTHIALSDSFSSFHKEKRTSFDGVNFPAFVAQMQAEEAKPRTKAELIALLRQRGEETATWLESLSDDFLAEPFTQPAGSPASKSRFEMIMGMKEHEMHHRGQLMLVERMLGITPHLTRAMQERFAAAQARS